MLTPNGKQLNLNFKKMGETFGFIIMAKEPCETTNVIEQVFREKAEEMKKRLDEYMLKNDMDGKPDIAIKEEKVTDENKTHYFYYLHQGYFIPQGEDPNAWFKKVNGILNSKKNKEYKVFFESTHTNTGFKDIYGGGGGTWRGLNEKVSYFDQELFYAIVDKIKKIKNSNVKFFCFKVDNGIRRTSPKFIQDWPGEFM